MIGRFHSGGGLTETNVKHRLVTTNEEPSLTPHIEKETTVPTIDITIKIDVAEKTTTGPSDFVRLTKLFACKSFSRNMFNVQH
jgi:hypothetical protein